MLACGEKALDCKIQQEYYAKLNPHCLLLSSGVYAMADSAIQDYNTYPQIHNFAETVATVVEQKITGYQRIKIARHKCQDTDDQDCLLLLC